MLDSNSYKKNRNGVSFLILILVSYHTSIKNAISIPIISIISISNSLLFTRI